MATQRKTRREEEEEEEGDMEAQTARGTDPLRATKTYAGTIRFIRSFLKINLFISVCVVVAIIIYLLYLTPGDYPTLQPERFWLFMITLSLTALILLLFTFRDQWPVNVMLMQVNNIGIGYIVGFVMCLHLKLLIATIINSDVTLGPTHPSPSPSL